MRKSIFLSSLAALSRIAEKVRAVKGKPVDVRFAGVRFTGDAELEQLWETPDEAAVKFFRGKGVVLSSEFREVLDEFARVRAFTIARVNELSAIEAIQDVLGKAIEEGWTRTAFLEEVAGLAELSPFRWETIFRTNTATAFSASKWAGVQEAEEYLPHLKYVGISDGRERHGAFFGTVLPVGDPFWDKYWPPNGYNCRCDVVSVSRFEIEKGYERISNRSRIVARNIDKGFDVNVGKVIYQDRDFNYGVE